MAFTARVARLGLDVFADLLSVRMLLNFLRDRMTDVRRMVSVILIDCLCVTEHLRCSTLVANCIDVMILHLIKHLC